MSKEILTELFDKGHNLMYFLLQYVNISKSNLEFDIHISKKGINFQATEQSQNHTWYYGLSQDGDTIKYHEVSKLNK